MCSSFHELGAETKFEKGASDRNSPTVLYIYLGRHRRHSRDKMQPGLPPPFLHTASDQKLDGGKAWERGYELCQLLAPSGLHCFRMLIFQNLIT